MAKDIITAYRNVCRDLTGLEAYEPIARKTLEQAHKVLLGGRMPSNGSICYVPITTAIPSYNEAVDNYNETRNTIQQLRTVKAQLEGLIARMSEPEQMLIALQVDGGLDLRQIAEKSNYSYSHVKRLSMNIRNRSVIEMMIPNATA